MLSKKALIHICTFWGCTKLTKEPATQRKVSLGRVGTVGNVPIWLVKLKGTGAMIYAASE